MAAYVVIRKLGEDERVARYAFGPGELDLVGELLLDKASGEVVVTRLDLDGRRAEVMIARVRHELRQHRETGEYPDVTCWAS